MGEYKGVPPIWHEGNTMGFTATLAFLPDQDLGISIMSNTRGSNGFNQAIRLRLLELIFGLESEFEKQAVFGLVASKDAIAKLAGELVEIDEVSVAPYLGQYLRDVLGEMTIELEDGELIMDVGESVLRPAEMKVTPAIYFRTLCFSAFRLKLLNQIRAIQSLSSA